MDTILKRPFYGPELLLAEQLFEHADVALVALRAAHGFFSLSHRLYASSYAAEDAARRRLSFFFDSESASL